MGDGCWELKNEIVIEISLHYLLSIELISFASVLFKILGNELMNLANSGFVVQPEIVVWKLALMDRFDPSGLEVKPSLSSVNGNLLEVLFLVWHALVQPSHHL